MIRSPRYIAPPARVWNTERRQSQGDISGGMLGVYTVVVVEPSLPRRRHLGVEGRDEAVQRSMRLRRQDWHDVWQRKRLRRFHAVRSHGKTDDSNVQQQEAVHPLGELRCCARSPRALAVRSARSVTLRQGSARQAPARPQLIPMFDECWIPNAGEREREGDGYGGECS